MAKVYRHGGTRWTMQFLNAVTRCEMFRAHTSESIANDTT